MYLESDYAPHEWELIICFKDPHQKTLKSRVGTVIMHPFIFHYSNKMLRFKQTKNVQLNATYLAPVCYNKTKFREETKRDF